MARILDHNGRPINDSNGSALLDSDGLELPTDATTTVPAEDFYITIEDEDRYITA